MTDRAPVDVVLASAPLTLNARYGKLKGAGYGLPALGLLYLAGAARRHGHRVAVVDAAAMGMPQDESAAAILERSPSVVGLSATTLGIASAASLAARLKSAAPALRVVVGWTARDGSSGRHLASIRGVRCGRGG